MPFPRRCDIDEVEIVARDESFKISLAVGVDSGSLLAGFLDHLRRARTLVTDDVTNGVNDDLINGEKLAEYLCAAQANSDDAEAHDITRFEPDADHRLPSRATNLFDLVFGGKAVCDIGCAQSEAGEAGGFEQLASR
jgi:hypothetical protein